jgi:hypothetical protein
MLRRATVNPEVAACSEPIAAEWFLVAEVCNVPNLLMVAFRIELICAVLPLGVTASPRLEERDLRCCAVRRRCRLEKAHRMQ